MVRALLAAFALALAIAATPVMADTGPDSLAGVLALLDRDHPDPQRVAHLRQVLATPPPSAEPTGQVQWLWQQGKAALGLGLTARSLDSIIRNGFRRSRFLHSFPILTPAINIPLLWSCLLIFRFPF